MTRRSLPALALLVGLLTIVQGIQAQDTLDLLDALSIVRESYGSDIVVGAGGYNSELACWEFEFEDATSVCVNDTTGEFVDSDETEPTSSIEGLILFGGVAAAGMFAYLWVRKAARPRPEPAISEAGFPPNRRIGYSVNRITIWLAGIACYLALQSIFARAIQEWFDHPPIIDRVVRFVNINLENSLPTWYASSLLLLVALAVVVIAHTKIHDPFRPHWWGLAVIFAFLSLDEAASIHEELTIPLRDILDTTGLLHFAWVIVGAIFVGVVALAYLRFLLHLPRPIRNLMILGAAVFVGGALVIESYSASLYAETGTSLLYSAIGTLEELLELLGAVLFIRAMLMYLQTQIGDVQIMAVEDTEQADR